MFFDELKKKMNSFDKSLVIPPLCFDFLKMKIEDFDEKSSSLTTSLPLFKELLNPAEFVQGGLLTAMIDNTIGPLSYLVAKKATTSLELNTSFLRPCSLADKILFCKASLKHQSKSYLIFEGDIRGKIDQKLKVTAQSRMLILS